MATIPIPESPQPDIYSLGFDRGLNRGITDNSTAVVYDGVGDASNAAQVLSGGNLNLKTISVGNLVKQVAPGDDIQAAIDAISREGGGTVQLLAKTYLIRAGITLRSNVVIAGAGKDLTVLDFNNGILVFQGSNIDTFGIRDLNIENSSTNSIDLNTCNNFALTNLIVSGHVIGIRVFYSNNFVVSNCYIASNSGSGVHIDGSNTYQLDLVESTSNSSHGFRFEAASSTQHRDFSVTNCIASSNGANGFSVYNSGTGLLTRFTFINCRASENTTDGFDFDRAVLTAWRGRLVSCISQTNTGKGYDMATSTSLLVFVGCFSDNNGGGGFQINGNNTYLVGCVAESNTSFNYDINSSTTALVGCNDGNTPMYEATYQEKIYNKLFNNSGADLRQGNVVVFNGTTDVSGPYVTTTSTNGDNRVFGMVNETITSGTTNFGQILIEGVTGNLYVANGTSSITAGDWLSTYSHAYYSKKAIAGETIFAVALATPTTGTAAIAARLFSPRTLTDSTSSPITSGTYTPTLTNVANLDGSVTDEFQYSRVGNTVSVSGGLQVNPTTTVTSTQLGISLPIASNFGSVTDCAGVAYSPTIATQGAAVLADATNDRAQMQWVAGDVTAQSMYITFMYQVI